MNDDRFAEQLGELIREVDPPPPTPREAIWAKIEAARRVHWAADAAPEQEDVGRAPGSAGAAVEPLRRSQRAARSSRQGGAGRGVASAPSRLRRAGWARWAVPLAAALLVGIGIGRVFGPVQPGARQEQASAVEAGDGTADLPYRLVAAKHLSAAEALLSALPHDARHGDAESASRWAEDLLVTTRLLLDSPAAADAQLAALFQDLELVLAQIASLSAARAEDEVELIEEGMRQNHVLLRMRAATMQRTGAGI
ncbi:MAG: hypothetical protein ACREM1_16155 [Longimicrobiales bacterium]